MGVVKEGVLSWRLKDKKKWNVSFIVVSRDNISIYKDTQGIRADTPQLRLSFANAEVDWFCSRTKKQGHRIIVDTNLAKVILKIDDEIDSHAWYQTCCKAVEETKAWLENNRPLVQSSDLTRELGANFRKNRTRTETNFSTQTQARLSSRLSQSVEHLSGSPTPSISGPTNVVKYSPEEVLKQISVLNSVKKPSENKKESKSQTKLGRKGLSKSFRKMASGLQMKSRKADDSDDEEVQVRPKKGDQLEVKTVAAKRRSINREPSRRSVYLSKFLKKRPTYEEIKASGLIQDNSVFGCRLEHQRIIHGKTLQVPEFVWKCVEKLESDPTNLATEGIYRVPGDAAKIQKLRIDIDQGKWDSFEESDDVHVLAGSLKLFLRELPDPLIPYNIHSECVKAAMGLGPYKEDVAQSLDAVLDKLDIVERDTLEVVVKHLAKVAKAKNKMDIDNLGLLFGQVLLWPDPLAPLDMKLIAEAAKNVQVADALIRYSDKIFPAPLTLSVPV